jgi:hypothetical protein
MDVTKTHTKKVTVSRSESIYRSRVCGIYYLILRERERERERERFWVN